MADQKARVAIRVGTLFHVAPSQAHASSVSISAGVGELLFKAARGIPATVTISPTIGFVATPHETAAPIIFGGGILPNANGGFIDPMEFDKGLPPVIPNASQIPYPDSPYNSVADALDALLYVAPVITSLTNSFGTVEIGRVIVNVNVSWTYNKTMTSATLTDAGDVLADSSYIGVGPYTTDKTWTLTASDGINTVSAGTTLAFRRNRYWGASASTSLDDAAIIALGGSEFATNFNKAVTYDCSGGKYPYLAYPSSFGTPSAVTVGGLAFSDFSITVQSFTNASGHVEDYNVLRFNNIQTGAAISVVWQ